MQRDGYFVYNRLKEGRVKMILYHASDREIRKPDIHYGRKNSAA